MKDSKFDKFERVELGTTTAPEQHVLEEAVPDGINIHITGSQIDKISNIEIYFKEEK